MECVVAGIVLTAVIVRAYNQSTQSWDGLAKQLSYTKVKPFRLEGKNKGLRVILERVPSKIKGTQTTEIRIQTSPGWPKDLIIHSNDPASIYMPTLPTGSIQAQGNPLFSLKYSVLNHSISDGISTRLLNLPKADFFLASHNEIRFVFFNTATPTPVNIRKLLFQLQSIMKKIKTEGNSSKESAKESKIVKGNSFTNVNYEELVDTFTLPAKSKKKAIDENKQVAPVESSMLLEEPKEVLRSSRSDTSFQIQTLPKMSAPTTEEEEELLSIHKTLTAFAVSSKHRETMIQQCTITAIEVMITDIRRTFELGMEKEYQNGMTLLGQVSDVPVRIYLPQSQNHLWKKKNRGERQQVSVRIYSYDVLQKRLVFTAI